MNQTTEAFLRELKSKPLDQYTMSELQIKLQETHNLFTRFGKTEKNVEERNVLNTVWNKMSTRYQQLFKQKYPETSRVVYHEYLIQESDG